jgi:hypothetical protein
MDKSEYRAKIFMHCKELPRRQTLDVSDIFHNDEILIKQKAKVISERLLKLPNADDELRGLAEELAEVDNAKDFDFLWSGICGWADSAGVWIMDSGRSPTSMEATVA